MELVAAFSLAVALSACSRSDPARAEAEHFLDRHYVEMNLERSLEHTAGLARAKVEEEIRLLVGQQAPEEGSKPSVHYRFLEQQEPREGRRGFLYEATITIERGLQVKRRLLISVKEDGGVWRVANFQEMD